MHCCPPGTVCDPATSSCVNSTVSMPWVERTSAGQPRLSKVTHITKFFFFFAKMLETQTACSNSVLLHLKSFRMIKSYMREEDDNICPDQSRCPAEFSCLRALTRFGCCPLPQVILTNTDKRNWLQKLVKCFIYCIHFIHVLLTLTGSPLL